MFSRLYIDVFICFSVGEILFINSFFSHNTVANERVLSKYDGSFFNDSINLFSSQDFKNSLYHKIWEINFAHSSVSLNLFHFIDIDLTNSR